MTCVAFSIKFAKTNQKFTEHSEFCENYSLLFKIIHWCPYKRRRCTTASGWGDTSYCAHPVFATLCAVSCGSPKDFYSVFSSWGENKANFRFRYTSECTNRQISSTCERFTASNFLVNGTFQFLRRTLLSSGR